MNILFTYYIKIKEASTSSIHPNLIGFNTSKMFVMWFTILLLVVMFFTGIFIISSNDIDSNLIGKFYVIGGFTFLILSIGFLVISYKTII